MSPGRSSASPKVDTRLAATPDMARLIVRVISRNASRLRPPSSRSSGLPGQGQVVLGEDALSRARGRRPERAPRLEQNLQLEPGQLGHLLARVAASLALQYALQGQQGQPVLPGGAAKLLQPEALLLEGAQQLEASFGGPAVLGALQQPLGLEVDRHGAHGHRSPRHGAPPAGRPRAPSARPRSVRLVIAKVEPLTPARSLRGPFDYRLAGGLADVGVGSMLVVPFGPRRLLGVVVELAEESELPDERLSEPLAALEADLPEPLVRLGLWVAHEYVSTPARGLALVLPPGTGTGSARPLRPKRSLRAALTPEGQTRAGRGGRRYRPRGWGRASAGR